MKKISALIVLSLAVVVFHSLSLTAQDVLPRPATPFKGQIGTTVKDSTLDFPKEVQAPQGAPNILLVSADETLDIGEDTGTPVSEDYHVPFKFTGTLNKVVINLSEAKLSAAEQKALDEAEGKVPAND